MKKITFNTNMNLPSTGKTKSFNSSAFIISLLFILLVSLSTVFAANKQFKHLKLTITSCSNLHLQELEWLAGTTAYPTTDMTSNETSNYIATPSFQPFDGKIDKLYIGAASPYNVVLELKNSSITPTSIRIQKPDWSTLNGFDAYGSEDGNTWIKILSVTNATNWDGVKEFATNVIPETPSDPVTSASYKHLRLRVTGSSNLHLQELEWLSGSTAYPTTNMATNETNDYLVSPSFLPFDGKIDKLYIGAVTGYNVDLELKNTAIVPTSVRIQKPVWSTLNSFEVYGSNNGSTWDKLLTITNPENWEGFKEFTISTAPVTPPPPTTNTYSQLKLKITNCSNLHIQELEWLSGSTAYPTTNMTSLETADYIASPHYQPFDGSITSLYIGAASPYDVDLKFKNTAIAPTSVRIQKPSWSTLTSFEVYGSNDGNTWAKLLTVSNPENWEGFKEFTISDVPVTPPPPTPSDKKNEMAINMGWVNDYTIPVFADVMMSRRNWKTPTWSADLPASQVTAEGWPLVDASCVIMSSNNESYRPGTYKLRYNGNADVSVSWGGGISIQNKIYNSSTNITTANFVMSDPNAQSALIVFKNITSAISNIKLMRPIASHGVAHGFDETFDRKFKELISKFSIVRYMDASETNSNPQQVWSDRILPNQWQRATGFWSIDFHDGSNPTIMHHSEGNTPKGISWEYIIALSNETGTDPWINIPHNVDANYVTELAKLFKYGGNGFSALNADRKLYTEYSNEVWNTMGGFIQTWYTQNDAIANVRNNINHPINHDGLCTTDADIITKRWDLLYRQRAFKAVENSKIFRSVFGDEQMMSRIRPLYLWQVHMGRLSENHSINFIEDYYSKAEGHQPNYYFYGGGPAAYYTPADNLSETLNVNDIWNRHEFDTEYWGDRNVDYDSRIVATYGLKYFVYEGGPGFGSALGTGGELDVSEEAFYDPRMKNEVIEHQNEFSKKGGDVFCYYVLNHDYRWTFVTDLDNANTYKMQAVDALAASDRATSEVGIPIPSTIKGGNYDFYIPAWKLDNAGQQNREAGHNIYAGETMAYRVNCGATTTYNISFEYKTTATSQIELFAGGNAIASINIPNTGNAIATSGTFSFNATASELYAIRIQNSGTNIVRIENIVITDALKSTTSSDITLDTEGESDDTIETTSESSVSIYPNPLSSSSDLNIKLAGYNNTPVQIMVSDICGKVIYNQKNTNITDISISNSIFKQGLYIINIISESKQLKLKLVVQ